LLGFTYLCAFASAGFQLEGLMGSRGIVPIDEPFGILRERLGDGAFLRVPSVFWLGGSDGMIEFVRWAGTLFSFLLMVRFLQGLRVLVSWVLYHSIVSAGGVLFNYQWDILLLDTGFLTLFFAPWKVRPAAPETRTSRVTLFLYRWLLFRLLFMSA